MKIGITCGDPAGIGPEIAVKSLLLARNTEPEVHFVLYGAPEILDAARLRFAPELHLPEIVPCGELCFEKMVPGRLDPACGKAAYDAVVRAANDACAGRIQAMVTCPVNKAAVNHAGIPFTGHTELVASICGVPDFAMMQSAGTLRVIFVTTHIPLREVPSAVTRERIFKTAHLLRETIRAEGVAEPKIAVMSLNPHAGENGHMGLEDEQTVKPAIRALLDAGFDVEGPFPPDTMFLESVRTRFDGILSQYHDQGHIPFKMLAFDRGVNSTLGLPIIRTSVDHGTAFEIAWRGIADPGSMNEAVRVACLRARSRTKPTT